MAVKELFTTILYNDPALKGYWRFENTSGTTVTDSSTASHNGTASRTNIIQGDSGQFGYCGTFVKTSSDKVTITDHADLKQTAAFSIGIWLKAAEDRATNHVVFQSYSVNTNIAGVLMTIEDTTGLGHIISGKNTGIVADTDYIKLLTDAAIDDNSWHLLVATFDGTTYKLYLDGGEDDSKNFNAPVYAATNYIRIGSRCQTGTDDSFMNGYLDEAFYFSRALSATEISNYYNGLLANRGSSPLFFVQL